MKSPLINKNTEENKLPTRYKATRFVSFYLCFLHTHTCSPPENVHSVWRISSATLVPFFHPQSSHIFVCSIFKPRRSNNLTPWQIRFLQQARVLPRLSGLCRGVLCCFPFNVDHDTRWLPFSPFFDVPTPCVVTPLLNYIPTDSHTYLVFFNLAHFITFNKLYWCNPLIPIMPLYFYFWLGFLTTSVTIVIIIFIYIRPIHKITHTDMKTIFRSYMTKYTWFYCYGLHQTLKTTN